MVMSNGTAPEGEGKGSANAASPALGKGLGNLLNGDRIAGNSSTPTEAPRFGRGMESLLGAPEKAVEKAESVQPAKRRELLPTWFFFAADFVLLVFCSAVLFDAPRPFTFGDLMFCAVAVLLGCCFGLAGVVRATSEIE